MMKIKLHDEILKEKLFHFVSSYFPFQIWALEICYMYHDILKRITTRSLKLGQLIEDFNILTGEIVYKKVILFFRVIVLCKQEV